MRSIQHLVQPVLGLAALRLGVDQAAPVSGDLCLPAQYVGTARETDGFADASQLEVRARDLEIRALYVFQGQRAQQVQVREAGRAQRFEYRNAVVLIRRLLEVLVDLETRPCLVRVNELPAAEADVRRFFRRQFAERNFGIDLLPAGVELELRQQLGARRARVLAGDERIERGDLQVQIRGQRLRHCLEQG